MAFERHRDKNGEMSQKHGNTLVRTLRNITAATLPTAAPILTNLAMCSTKWMCHRSAARARS
jgi:hypothetical protein